MIVLLVYMLVKIFFEQKKQEETKELEEIKKPFFLLAGVGGGVIASLSGLGGGVLMMPIFTSFLKIDIKKAVLPEVA